MDKNIWLEWHRLKDFCDGMEDVPELLVARDSLEEMIVMAWESIYEYTPSPYAISFVMNKAREVIEQWEIQREADRMIAEIAEERQREERVRRATERIVCETKKSVDLSQCLREAYIEALVEAGMKVNDAQWSNS